MARVEYRPNRNQLTKMAQGMGSVFVRQQVAPRLRAEIAQRAPGSLKGAVQIRPGAGGGAEVGFFGEAGGKARLLSTGTMPHIITARSKNALVFMWDKVGAKTVVPKKAGGRTGMRGGVFWVGKGHVDHPGMKANDFMKEALAAVRASGLFTRGGGGRFASARFGRRL